MPPIDDDIDLDNEDRGDDFEPTDDPVVVGADEVEVEVVDEPVETPKAKAKEPVEKEATPDPVEEDEEEEEEEASPKEHMIPKGRFDEVNAKRRAAEARIAELEAAANANAKAAEEGEAHTFDFDAKEEALSAALIDGDAALAKSLRAEIRAAERAQITREIEATATAKAAETLAKSETKTKADAAVEKVSKAYPIFDTESETFDQDMTDEAIAMARGYQSQGYAFPEALEKAVGNMAKIYGLVAEGATKTAGKAKVDVDKTQDKLDAAAKQPPKGKSATVKDTPPDIDEMTDAEWDALPPSVKKRMRGD